MAVEAKHVIIALLLAGWGVKSNVQDYLLDCAYLEVTPRWHSRIRWGMDVFVLPVDCEERRLDSQLDPAPGVGHNLYPLLQNITGVP